MTSLALRLAIPPSTSPRPANHQSHPYVLDRTTGTWVSLNEFLTGVDYGDVVENKRVGLRLELVENAPRYVCPRCLEAMTLASVAVRLRDESRFYFRHQFETVQCGGVAGLGERAISALRFQHTKESEAHKRFKARIVESLQADSSFVGTDTERRFNDVNGIRWRQPDVQTSRGGQRIVFEAQLSTTFLHVIAERMRFYVRNDAVLIWLFRDLSISEFRQSEDDIFFSNNRNAFRVSDDTVALSRENGRFAIECFWLEPVVDREGSIQEVENRRIVFFDELSFDVSAKGAPRAYFFDYDSARARASRLVDGFVLRQRFESYWLGDQADTAEWLALRKHFAKRRIILPEWPTGGDGMMQLLNTLYSVKHWRMVGWRHANIVTTAHHLLDVRRGLLRAFRYALKAYGRDDEFRAIDVGKRRFADKANELLPRMRNGDAEFAFEGRFTELSSFLFPEIESRAFR